MRAFYFCEMSFHPAWDKGQYIRNELPSMHYDPQVGADLYNRFLDEYALCDELGLNIMVNEHHSTATCLNVACAIPLSILARQTKKARLLALGMPIANRLEPLRVAEELALIDVISRGRLEMGLVKGSPYEVFPANSNPVGMMDRFWEAHDLILKAMTTHTGPFNWEGTHFHYRNVNLWPRPYQQPHPPVWITASSPDTARTIAQKGYVLATLNTGYARTRQLFDAYRKAAASAGNSTADDRFAYLALVAVGKSKKEGFERADKIVDYIRNSGRVAPQFANPPGYASRDSNIRALKASGRSHSPDNAVTSRTGEKITKDAFTVEGLIDAGVLFAGDPDMVYNQIKDFHSYAGGLGNLLMMAQGGWLDHANTVDNLTLFSKEVLPRLKELKADDTHQLHVRTA
jgi:alkanesulfonate monooxygenase SsuD/methylene tetrahydromethanopterin reductase-like flavin-dependent oxidoreductase (luciferase family)